MDKEENVYETEERTEDTAAVSRRGEDRNTAPEQASAVLGKFKDVDALIRAYGSLQAEFTRRSQRLKELERAAENFGKDGRSGAEKLRKNADARRAEAKRFEEFLSNNEKAENADAEAIGSAPKPAGLENETAGNTPSVGDVVENGGTVYETNTETANEETAEKVASDPLRETARGEAYEDGTGEPDDLYTRVCRDEKVRLRIIGEYLSSIGKPNVPLMTGGVGTLTTPPVRAKSISAAGDMALLYFKKPKGEG